MKCTNCSADLAPEDLFCGQCGTPRARLPQSFEDAAVRFAALKARYDAGELQDAEYDAELQKLVLRDGDGTYWMIGAETGQWYRYDGQRWVLDEPSPESAQPTRAGAPAAQTPQAPLPKLPAEAAPRVAPPRRRWPRVLLLPAAGVLLLLVACSAVVLYFGDTFDDLRQDFADLRRPVAPVPVTQTPTRLPRPTDTTRPRPSATPTANAAFAFEDDFDDASAGWSQGESDDYRRWIELSEHHILVKRSQWAIWSTRWPPENSYADFIYTALVRWVDDVPGACALIFRYQDNDHFYYFHASSNGYFKVGKRVDGEWMDIAEWTYSEAIDALENALQVVCQGNSITVYANDELLTSVTDEAFVEGDIGLLAQSFDEPGTHVAFDWVAVSSLD